MRGPKGDSLSTDIVKKYVPTSQSKGLPGGTSRAPRANILVELDLPASPVAAAFGSVR